MVDGDAFPSPVPPGTGWPDDPADAETPVAEGVSDVLELARSADDLAELTARQSVCRACPRLVEWREQVAVERRKSFASEAYWGRPIAGWGSDRPRVLIVGLAPAAHGGNRTGRIFTGDRSGDWLFAALHRVGLAAIPTSTHAGDGQALIDARMVASVRCAPPANKPLPVERDACFPWLVREIELCAPYVRSVVALGSYGWDAVLKSFAAVGYDVPKPKPKFGHGATAALSSGPHPVRLVGAFHPSQQNTFTGRLTEGMLEDVFHQAKAFAGLT